MKTHRLFLAVFFISFCLGDKDEFFVNKFAVSLRQDLPDADKAVKEIAESLGFTVEHKLESISVYLLSHSSVQHRSKRSAESHLNRLQSHPQVLHAQQETELIREKREIIYDKQQEFPIRDISDPAVYHRVSAPRLSVKDDIPRPVIHFKDPFYKDQWYINNVGQSGGKVGLDLNVMIAWQNNFNGSSIVVSILDDGVDHNHLDLIDNYDPNASTDLNDLTDKRKDPMPNTEDSRNSHGTRCAGEIASKAGNNVCGVGIAFGARIGGVRMLDGTVTDSLEAAALNFNINYIDILSASWGPKDDGRTMETPKHYATQALEHGAKHGRHGKGTIYAWATGNGGANDDDCGADGYVSSIYTLSFGSITDMGRRPYFMENCTSTLAVVPSGGEEVKGEERVHDRVKLKVVTTDVNNKCIENFQGTSSAAPLAAGCLALVLQANPHLTWRDVQHIVVRGSRLPSVDNSWIINGANLHVSHSFGFGVMDCGEMVRLAQNWQMVPEQHVCHYNRFGLYKEIHSNGFTQDYIYISGGCVNDAETRIEALEHVQIKVKIDHNRRGDVQIFLTSPSGTRSEMLSPRSNDDTVGGVDFTFMTVHSWMERPHGVWSLEVHNNPGSSGRSHSGQLVQWELVLYGTSGYRFNDVSARHVLQTQEMPHTLQGHLVRVMEEEEKRSKFLMLRRLSNDDDDDDVENVWNRRVGDENDGGELSRRKPGRAEQRNSDNSLNSLSNNEHSLKNDDLAEKEMMIDEFLKHLRKEISVENDENENQRETKEYLSEDCFLSEKAKSDLRTRADNDESVRRALEKLVEFLETES